MADYKTYKSSEIHEEFRAGNPDDARKLILYKDNAGDFHIEAAKKLKEIRGEVGEIVTVYLGFDYEKHKETIKEYNMYALLTSLGRAKIKGPFHDTDAIPKTLDGIILSDETLEKQKAN